MADQLPPIQSGVSFDGYDGRYRIWTVNEVPWGRFPSWPEGPPTVAHTEWGVSYPRLCRWLSSPEVVAADDGMVELSVSRLQRNDDGRTEIIRHPLNGSKYATDDDAQRAAYEAGLTAYMLYVRDEARHGIVDPSLQENR